MMTKNKYYNDRPGEKWEVKSIKNDTEVNKYIPLLMLDKIQIINTFY